MACRNCGRSSGEFYEVVLAGEEAVEVTLCAGCYREYDDLDWVADATPREG